MKLVPLFDRVVLKKMVEEETTASGIVLPGKGDKEKPGQGEVMARAKSLQSDRAEWSTARKSSCR